MDQALPNWLIEILRGSATPRDATNHLLFHGTIEPFDGPLTASSWEHLRWTAEDPAVAQAYCPETGSTIGWSVPNAWELDQSMLPHGEINRIIFRQLGFNEEDLGIELDAHGSIQSWRVLPNHPKWRDACSYMEGLGYKPTLGLCWVKTHRTAAGHEILPADFKAMGRLFILERPKDLKIYNYAPLVDGGLTGQQWMHTDTFKAVAQSGQYDGIQIDDVHQSPKLGHFSHTSIGLFAPTLAKLRYHVIDIKNVDPWDSWQHINGCTTPEFDALWASCRVELAAAA